VAIAATRCSTTLYTATSDHARCSGHVWCSVLQYVAECCSVLQCGQRHVAAIHCTAICDSGTALVVAAHCNRTQHAATHCNTCYTLPKTAKHYNTLQHTTTHYITLQHTTAHYNTLQHTVAHLTKAPRAPPPSPTPAPRWSHRRPALVAPPVLCLCGCVAVCYSVLRCLAVCCSILQNVAARAIVSRH